MDAKNRSFISEVVQKEKERLVLPLCHMLQSYGQNMWQDLVIPLSEFVSKVLSHPTSCIHITVTEAEHYNCHILLFIMQDLQGS